MANEKPYCMRVIAFFDGRPGHEKQTRGILHALREMVELEIIERRVPQRSLWGDILDFLCLLRPGQGDYDSSFPEGDLLIGTGSRTHFPMLRAKKQTGLPVVTCMTPAVFLRKQFDLIFAPEHDGVDARDNIIRTIGPPNCATITEEKISGRGLILIGGIDRKSHFWSSSDIEGYVRQIAKRENDVQWTIATSPRTPAETVQRLDVLAQEISNLRLFRFEETASGWIERQYSECMRVWVTADSMSMIYEALSAGCRVGLLPLRWKKKNSKFRRSEEFLSRNGMVVSYLNWLSGTEVRQTKQPLNEAKHCAEEILKRWLPKN